jgi:DNA-binding CsgD family transcriptional regulator
MSIDSNQFSEREKDVVKLLLLGKSNKQIALELGITNRTVEFHLGNIYTKLGVTSRTETFLKLSESHLWKSTGNDENRIQVKSTVDINSESVENGVKPISRRIPMNKMYMIIGGLLTTTLVVVLVLANIPAQNTEVIPTVQANATSVIQPPTETSLPPTSTLTLEPVLTTMTAAAVPSIMDVAHFVGENYPDGTNVVTGATFTKTWKLQNAGTTTWTTGYSFVMTEASYPLGESQGHPPVINLPHEVKPGETVEISANIVAPKIDTLYEVHYKLKNADGQFVSGDGNEIWFKVAVGNVSAVTNSVKPSNVTMQLVNLQKEAATTTAEICAQLPDTRGWILDYAILNAGSVQAEFTSFRLKNSKDPNTYTNSYRCFFFEFPVGSNDYGNEPVKISINEVHIPSDASNCLSVKPQLVAQYPGLDFTCATEPGYYYSNLKLPTGMTESEADKVIMDALEYAIYGPWILSE